jgi:hypothetical protein
MNDYPPEWDDEDPERIEEALRGYPPRTYRCAVCRVNAVDAEDGYDSCEGRLAKQ